MSLSSRLDAVIDRAIGTTIVGANILVAVDGAIAYQRTAGFMDQAAGRAMQPGTIFRLASVTKPMVSAAALALVDAGKLAIDDPVTRFLPGFRPRLKDGSEPVITIRHLMTHTSGLTYDLGPQDGPEPVSGGIDGTKVGMTDNLARIARLPLAFAPGSAWAYGLGIDVLGGVLEAIEGRGLPEIVRHTVTGPLGLASMDFHPVDPLRLSVAYADGTPPHAMADPETVTREDGGSFTFSPGRAFDRTVFASGGAGMCGSAEDFLAFLEVLRKGGAPILSPASMALLSRCQIAPLSTDRPGRGFSLGWSIFREPQLEGSLLSPGSWGWGGVYGHQWRVDPVRKISVASFTNTAVEGCNGAFPDDITAAIFGG